MLIIKLTGVLAKRYSATKSLFNHKLHLIFSDDLGPSSSLDIVFMALDRSKGRNVSIFAADDPTQTILGGLVLTNGVTNQNFYSMIEILLVFQSAFSLQGEGGNAIERNNHPLQPGNYYVVGGFIL